MVVDMHAMEKFRTICRGCDHMQVVTRKGNIIARDQNSSEILFIGEIFSAKP
jgi:hypothetical protein